MLDINLIRQNPELVKEGIAKKNYDPSLVDDFLAIDREWREVVKEIDDLRAEQKKLSVEKKIEEAKELKLKIHAAEADLKKLEEKRNEILYKMPNVPLASAPLGKDESENVVVREIGKKPAFKFEPKDHLELAEALHIIDFRSGSKVTGSGFYFLQT